MVWGSEGVIEKHSSMTVLSIVKTFRGPCKSFSSARLTIARINITIDHETIDDLYGPDNSVTYMSAGTAGKGMLVIPVHNFYTLGDQISIDPTGRQFFLVEFKCSQANIEISL